MNEDDARPETQSGEAKWKLLVYEIADAAETVDTPSTGIDLKVSVAHAGGPLKFEFNTSDMRSMTHWLKRDVKAVLKERGL